MRSVELSYTTHKQDLIVYPTSDFLQRVPLPTVDVAHPVHKGITPFRYQVVLLDGKTLVVEGVEEWLACCTSNQGTNKAA